MKKTLEDIVICIYGTVKGRRSSFFENLLYTTRMPLLLPLLQNAN